MALSRWSCGIVLLAASAVLGCAEVDDASAPPSEHVGAARQEVV